MDIKKILNEWVAGEDIIETPDGVIFDRQKKKNLSFYKSEELYNLYDTYAVIERGGAGGYSLYDTTTNTHKINRKERKKYGY